MDAQSERQRAIEIILDPPDVQTKVDALDALDRLALNPSGWTPNATLDKLTEARKLIITNRWADALLTLEETRASIEAFVRMLESQDKEGEDHIDALRRARAEMSQCVRVLSWLDQRPED